MRSRVSLAVLTATLALAPTAGAITTPLPADSTFLLSGASDLISPLAVPYGFSYAPREAMSADGRYVVFSSASDAFAADDDNSTYGIFVKDTVTGELTLVSRRADGTPAGFCNNAAISADGSMVAFVCSSKLDPHDTNTRDDVYVRNWRAAAPTTALVSRIPGGDTGSSESGRISISKTGAYIAFDTTNKLQPAVDTNAFRDVYRAHLTDMAVDEMVAVSRPTMSAMIGDNHSTDPSISDDGTKVTYLTDADNLAGATATTQAVLTSNPGPAGVNQIISATNGGNTMGTQPASTPVISADGTKVAFAGDSTYAGPDDGGQRDVFVRTVNTTTTTLASDAANAAASSPALDADGSVVSYTSQATNIAPGASEPAARIYVRDADGATLISRMDGDDGAPSDQNHEFSESALSDDGNLVLFAGEGYGGFTPDDNLSFQGVYVRKRTSPATTRLVSRPAGDAPITNQGGDAYLPYDGGASISSDGTRAVFHWAAPFFGLPTAVMRNLQTGELTAVARADGPNGAIDHDVQSVVISGDGRRVAWASYSALDPADTNGSSDVYVRDLASGRTWLASRADGAAGAGGNDNSQTPRLSADGTRVAFNSQATNLGDGDADPATHVHVRDLTAGRTLLASAKNGTDDIATNSAYVGDISADGTKVAFDSTATNLGTADDDADSDTFVRDLGTRATTLASAKADGSKITGSTGAPTLSDDGTKVAFSGTSSDIVTPAPAKNSIFVKDLSTGAVTVASRADGVDGAFATGDAFNARISGNGRFVAFTATAANLPGNTPVATNVFVRDLAAGRTELASGTPDGKGTEDGAQVGELSADGACLTLTSNGGLVPGMAASSDVTSVFVRAVTDGCVPVLPPVVKPPVVTPPVTKDTTRPVVSKASLTNRTFKVGAKATAISAAAKRRTRTGTTIKLTLSEPATVSLRFESKLAGRKVKGRCRPSKTKVRKGRCTLYKSDGSVIRRTFAKAGAVSIAFSGRIGRKALKPGVHRITITAVDAAGNRTAKATTLAVTVVRK